MPREGAEPKWKLEMTPDEWYQTQPDPWRVSEKEEEMEKAQTIYSMIPEADTGIDLGCGEGIFTKLYKRKIKKMWGVDISPTAIERAMEICPDVEFLVHDITKPLTLNKVDVVLINEVLYYVHPNNWKDISNNVYNLMKSKGKLVITCGQFFTLKDIVEMFPKIRFTTFYKKGNWFTMIGGFK